MNPWAVYRKRLFQSLIGAELTSIEKIALVTLMLMLAISLIDAFQGHSVSNPAQVHLAKIQGQQDLMAQQVPKE